MNRLLLILIPAHFIEIKDLGGKKTKVKTRQCVPVRAPGLAYGNRSEQAVMDRWCPAVPPLRPQRVNYSAQSELDPRHKQQHG